MATDTLRDFIEMLDREGELARVKARVSPVLEIAEICDRREVLCPAEDQETPPGMPTYTLIPNADQTFHVAIVGDDGARQTILGSQTEADAAAWMARDPLQSTTL